MATTAPWSAGRLTLDDAPAEPLGDAEGPAPYDDVLATARTAFAGLQAGVCAGALARAVAHTSTREQFGRPLSTNQGVLLRAADALHGHRGDPGHRLRGGLAPRRGPGRRRRMR